MEVGPDPMAAFKTWLRDARGAGIDLAETAVVATSDDSGRPSARAVLVREVDHGFVFYTNYHSRKGRELAVNPYASLCFVWQAIQRQVRVEGPVAPVTPELSDRYWRTRPRGSQLSAVISRQSEPVEDRTELERRRDELEAELDGAPIPRPDHWGGYRLVPDAIEFWRGRDDRLHDRLRYTRLGDGWRIERLSP